MSSLSAAGTPTGTYAKFTELLRLLNTGDQRDDILRGLINHLRDWSGCDAVGIRLRDGLDYPYFETTGFPEEFVRLESRLCSLDGAGNAVLDENGQPKLECMCGNVIQGRYNEEFPFFTGRGSFWTNSTTVLLAGTSETDRQSATRNRCHGMGYESVALVPLRSGQTTYGLLQFNDRRTERFTEEHITFLECLADNIAVALSRLEEQAALKESEARYRLLFESMDEGFCLIEVLFDHTGKSVDYRFLNVNPVFEKQTGIKNAVGRWMREIAPQHEEHWFKIYGDVALTGKSVRFENEARALGRFYEVYALRIGKPEQRQVVIFFNDITGRKRAEAALQESEKRFRMLANAIPQLAWIARTDGWIFWYNERWYEYTGTTAEQMEGWGWQRVHDPGVLPHVLEQWRESIATGRPFDMVFPLRGADGVFRSFLTRVMPMLDASGRVTQWFGTNTDISDQKRLEGEIKAAKDVADQLASSLEVKIRERTEELERKNRELQDFAFITSHDLQEPLRKIQTFGGRLREEYAAALGDRGRDFLLRMEKSASRMQAFIKDLLEYSRVTSRPNPFVSTDLAKIAREATIDLDSRIEETGGQIEIGELPRAEVDPGQMRQVLQNLIANALKYHGAEPPLVRVSGEIVATDGREVARILVRDNGIGFDERYRDKIFQPFQRLHGRSAYEGTGIGLAIVRKIVERHNGAVTAKSTPGEGSTFFVDIPLRQPKA